MFGKILTSSFFLKNLFLSSVNILVIGLLLTLSSYFIQGNLMTASLYDQAIGIAEHLKAGTASEDIQAAMENPDLTSDVQKRLTEHLTMLTANKNVAQGYIFGSEIAEGNKQMIVANPQHLIDAGLKPGDLYEMPEMMVEATKQAAATKQIVKTDIYTDDYGTWISIVQPVLDANGNALAVIGIDVDAKFIYDGQAELLMWSAIALAVLLIIMFIIQYISLQRLLAPLKDLFEGINEVSRGNLNYAIKVQTKDELGQLSDQFNDMTANLREIIRGVQQSADQSASSANELAKNVEESTHALNQITQTIQQVAAGAEMQQQASAESARAMQEMTIGIQRIAETSSTMAEASQDMAKEATVGDDAIRKVVDQIDSISKSVHHSASVVKLLDGRSQEIVQIVEVISGIASQTNLLALNAAIEAARAGEQGRGFAIVADEVRKLAEQSQRSATKISTLIKEIQEETSSAVEAMHLGTKEVEIGLQVARETGKAFKHILDNTLHVADQIQEISAVAEEMSAGSQEVAASVQELSGIAKNSSNEAFVVASASQKQLSVMELNAKSTELLNQMAQELKTLIGRFKV